MRHAYSRVFPPALHYRISMDREGSLAEFKCGDTNLRGEKFREVVFVFKSDGVRYFGYRHLGLEQKTLGFYDSFVKNILLRADIKQLFKGI